MAMQFVDERHSRCHHCISGNTKVTVEVLFNPLLGLNCGLPPPRLHNKEDSRPYVPVVTIGQLFNPLLELEQRQECQPVIAFEALNDVVVSSSSYLSSSSSSSTNRRNNRFPARNHQIELSALSSLDKLSMDVFDDDVGEDEVSFNTTTINNSKKGKRRVNFSDTKNVVHLIPSHRDYTKVEQDSIWSNPEEIEYNACRNRIEFRYEGWDWRHVLDETNFVLCSDGQLYHPITVELFLRQLEREDEAIRMVVRKRKVVASTRIIEESGMKRQRLSSLVLLQ